jgi:hypothetical protein
VVAAPDPGDHVEANILRMYAAIVVLLLVLGGLLWGTVTAVQMAPQPMDDRGFVLLALGGLALAGTVVVLLTQLAYWASRRHSTRVEIGVEQVSVSH